MTHLGMILRSLIEPRTTTIVRGIEATPDHDSDHPSNDEYLTLDKKRSKDKKESDRTQTKPPTKTAQIPALATPDLVVSPAFKLVVWLVFALIILSAAALVFLALQQSNPNLSTVMNLIGAAFSGSVGALLGLIGGKAIT